MQGVGPTESDLLSIGRLQFLAGYCPLHRQLPAFALARIFHPAINSGCVRFFENEHGKTAAALIWARLSDDVSERMLYERIPPTEADWVSGKNLWFLDLLAPFGHGRVVARNIARNPPPEPFQFARIDASGRVRRVVRGDARKPRGQRLDVWSDLSGKAEG
ncbi:toxin-activating lysine-acyltransferase [uncultured Shimia sp.]|uniref:toxin-activating lysine-acyltransferase n=1 Tax=uncultured Shimia sp. TaxID=573152 RepID=UPI00261620E3|nr:toxin-activating lysine-acyltransferase [uncultured Shimia sp.]